MGKGYKENKKKFAIPKKEPFLCTNHLVKPFD